MNKDIIIKDIQAEYIFHTNDEENKNKILEEAVINNKEACYVTYGTDNINSTYQPSPIKDDDYYMKYCNSDKYDHLKDYRLIWGHAIGIVEEDVIINTDTGEHLAEGEDCNNYSAPEGTNYKKGKWLRFSGINNLNPKVIQEVVLPDYIISFKDLCSSLSSIDIIEAIDTSNIYNMSNAFHNKNNIQFTINNTNKIIFDFNNVKDASSCFEYCTINNNSIDFINCSDFCNYARMFYYSHITYIPDGLNKQNIGGEYMFWYAKLTGNLNITMKLYNNMFDCNGSFIEDDSLTINGNFVCSNDINNALHVHNKLIFNANIDFANVENARTFINIYNGTLDLTTLPEDCNYEGMISGTNFNIIAPTFKLNLPLIKNSYNFTVNIINTLKYYTIFDSNINSKCVFCYFENAYYYPCNITINGVIETSFLFGGKYNKKNINLNGNLKLIDNCPANITYDNFATLCNRTKNGPELSFNINNDESINFDDYSTLDLLKITSYTKNINKENRTLLLTSGHNLSSTIYTNTNSKIYINTTNGNYNIINSGEANEIYALITFYGYDTIINAPNSNIYYSTSLSSSIKCNIDSAKKVKIDYNYDNRIGYNLCECTINVLNNIDSIEYNGGINVRLRNNKKLTLESSYVYIKNDINYNIFLPFDIWQVNESDVIVDSCPFPNLIHKNGDNYLICANNFYKDFDVNLLDKCIYRRSDNRNISFINGIQLINNLNKFIELSNSINTSNDIIIDFNNINSNRNNTLYCNGDYRKVTIKNFGGNLVSEINGEWNKQNVSDDEEKRYINYIPENIEGGMIRIKPGKSTYLNLLINIPFHNNNYSDFESTIIGYDDYEFNYETIIYSSTIFCPLIINIFNCQSLTHLDVNNAKFTYKLALNYCDNLDDDSINSIINAQYDDGTEVIISYIVYNKLTEEQKETIINKGCTLISFVYER